MHDLDVTSQLRWLISDIMTHQFSKVVYAIRQEGAYAQILRPLETLQTREIGLNINAGEI
jgi:hypothetical protein